MSIAQRVLEGRPLDDVFVFDAHAHCGPRKEIDRDTSPEAYVRRMDAVGIDVTCFMAFTPSAGVTLERHNDIVHAHMRAFPDRFRGYCWVNPNYPEHVDGELRRCFDQLGFSGIKFHTHSKHPYDGPRYQSTYAFANERRLPILAHTWGDVWLRQFAAMARQYPDAIFLAAHTGAGDMEVSIEEALRTPNLYLELCFSRGTPWQVETLVDRVGADRLVWGSDTLLFAASHQIGRVAFAGISEDDKRRILGGNARGIFRC